MVLVKKDISRFKISLSEAKRLKITAEDLKGITEIIPNEKYRIFVSNGFKRDGSRDRITETFNGSLVDAIARKKAIIKKAEDKNTKPLATSKFDKLVDSYINYLEEKVKNKQLELTTYESYYNYIPSMIMPYFKNMVVNEITERDVESWIAKLGKRKTLNKKREGKNLHPTTIAHAFKVLMNMFNYAKLERIVRENPCDFVSKKPTAKPDKKEYFTLEEMDYVKELLVNENIRLKTAIFLTMDTGCRREEIIGLKWKDIDFENKTIDINEAVVAISPKTELGKKMGRINYKDVKSVHSKRIIGVTKVCLNLLSQYKNFKKDCGLKVRENDYVFTNWDSNKVLDPNRLTHEWCRFRKENNITKDVPVHGLRHSNATFLLSTGIPDKDVARRLGHSPEVLARTYTHSSIEEDKVILANIEKEFYKNGAENFKIDSIVSIITNDINDNNKKDVYQLVDFLLGLKVEESNIDLYIETCKKCLLEQHPKLEMFNNKELINNIELLQMKLSVCKDLLGNELVVFSHPELVEEISIKI